MNHGTHTTSMPMPTSGMDDGMTMRMDATFFTSTTTPLWSNSFAPSNVGQYAGMCIFLIAFATIFRLLVALRMNFFQFASSFIRSSDRGHLLQPHGVASVEVEEFDKTVRRPWNATEAAVLGVVDVLIAGVSYLLMLAVMTMNVGYFFSVLGGVFVGTVLCGHLTGSALAH